ncbi:BTB and MATH domain-containing protein 36-like isoform X1 [Saccostrea cucullata]|uniref:BTB and MATH domain-containing protein 36-like isoform X1 n=1 Tax=Saccostrea cuccullata TaxID=36930 RepID=UPI002ED2C59D
MEFIDESTSDQFPEKPGTTDIALIIEGKKMYTVKSILSLASPVFKTMFSSNFKEKNVMEIELPGKTYRDFENFLMCLSPNKCLDFNDDVIGNLLPLAQEYQVDSIINKCENWLLKEIELTEARGYKGDLKMRVAFLLKYFYNSGIYSMSRVRQRTRTCLVKFKLSTYRSVGTSYERLSDKDKAELFEARIEKLDSLHGYGCQCKYRDEYFL